MSPKIRTYDDERQTDEAAPPLADVKARRRARTERRKPRPEMALGYGPAAPLTAAAADGHPQPLLMVPIADLELADYNPRHMDEQTMGSLVASMREWGLVEPIVVNVRGGKPYRIVGGHQRYEAAQKMGLSHLSATTVDLPRGGTSEKKLNLALNKVSGDFVPEMVVPMLEEIMAEPDYDLSQTGFTLDEYEAMRLEIGQSAEAPPSDKDPDAIPEPRAGATITQPGDLWVLGRHRLLCGDSTEPTDVKRLMRSDRAGLMNTDPPYGIAYANDDRPNPGVAKPRVAKPRVENDELSDQALQDFLEGAFRTALAAALTKTAAWYMWHAHLTQGYFAAAAAAAADVTLHRQIIWVKPVLLLGRGHYHWKHEPCFMGWVKGNQPPDYGEGNGERTQTTVWEIGGVSQKERAEFNHSSPKPVRLFEIPIIKHLKHGEIAYEPFAGSGPQFIAAEMTGRRCFGLELSPLYCDVIVRRWEEYTGQKAARE